MSATKRESETDWLNAFLPLGYTQGERWEPCGGSVLLLDQPLVWLVTARQVVESMDDREMLAWVPSTDGLGLLNITESQQRSDIEWLHHGIGLSATLFPVDPSFTVKAFSETQCTRMRDLKPMQPTISIGCLYGPDVASTPIPSPAVCDGIVSALVPESGSVYSTAPLLPRNHGAPLLLASPYGGAVTVAGILVDNAMAAEADPRVLPVRLSHSICIDAALELIRSEPANEQRRRVTAAATDKNASDAAPADASAVPAENPDS